MLRGLFADKPLYRKFLILVFLVMISSLLFFMVGSLLVTSLYGIDVLKDPAALQNMSDPLVIKSMKLLQFISSGIGMFILPSIMAAYLFSREPLKYLETDRAPRLNILLLTLMLMFAAVPVINLMLAFNQQMQLPSFLAGLENWLKSSEENAAGITEAFLVMNTPSELFYNLFIIALLPAIGEEFLFRGLIQKFFSELMNNIHAGIILSAILFSAIHMQFYGFIPRMMLGVLFGYLFYWSGNLWVPIFAHFINNAAAVIFAYIASKNNMPFNQDTIGTGEDELMIAIVSGIVVILIAITIKNLSRKNVHSQTL